MSRRKSVRTESRHDPWSDPIPEAFIRALQQARPGIDAEKWIEQTVAPTLRVPDPIDTTFWTWGVGGVELARVISPTTDCPRGDPQSERAALGYTQRSTVILDCDFSTAPTLKDPVLETAVDADSTPPDPDSILAELRSPADDAALGRAVLDAEVTDFTAAQSAELRGLLRQFIDRHRGTQDTSRLVEVGSAIRRYMAELPAGDLDGVAGIFDDDPNEAVELETAKMVVRKLSAVPPATDNQYPALAERLSELVDAYSPSRHLRRPVCAAILLNSVLASALIRGPAWSRAVDRLRGVTVRWFRHQVARRADRLMAEFRARFAGQPPHRVGATLTELIELGRA